MSFSEFCTVERSSANLAPNVSHFLRKWLSKYLPKNLLACTIHTDANFEFLPFVAPVAVSSSIQDFREPVHGYISQRKVSILENTWTGLKSLAAAIRFWLRTLIHSTCRCHSGGTSGDTGGGARREPVKAE